MTDPILTLYLLAILAVALWLRPKVERWISEGHELRREDEADEKARVYRGTWAARIWGRRLP